MWITGLLLCLTVIFSCSAQVTNNDVNTVTETARTNQAVEWDTTGPSVTLNIQDGRSGTTNAPGKEIPDHPLLFSNQWQPFLMPIGYNSYGDINSRHHTDSEDSINYQFMPTFLRRPDSDLNRTSSSRFAQLPSGFRYPMPMQMPPINPMLFYPHQPNMFPGGYYRESGLPSVLENSTGPTTKPAVSNTETSNLKDVQESLAPRTFAEISDVLQRFQPVNVYRNRDDLLPSVPPAFVPPYGPYPVLPRPNDNSFHPVAFPFLNSHLYDREGGSDIIETISTGQDVTDSQASATPRDVHEQEANVANGTPSDSSPTFVPPEPFPLPVAGFPFGVLPPPIFPPIIPGPASPPLSPLAEPVSIPNDSAVSDAILSHPPVPANRLPLESASGVFSPVNTLQSEAELSETVQANVEGALPDKLSNAKIPYEFGFDMNDGQGTDQHRKEVSDVSGIVRGSYGYRDMFGVYRFVNYIADKNGFRAFIKSNEPGVASSGSADVVVLAEHPPIQAIAEGEKASELEAVVIPDTTTDLVAEGSETGAK